MSSVRFISKSSRGSSSGWHLLHDLRSKVSCMPSIEPIDDSIDARRQRARRHPTLATDFSHELTYSPQSLWRHGVPTTPQPSHVKTSFCSKACEGERTICRSGSWVKTGTARLTTPGANASASARPAEPTREVRNGCLPAHQRPPTSNPTLCSGCAASRSLRAAFTPKERSGALRAGARRQPTL